MVKQRSKKGRNGEFLQQGVFPLEQIKMPTPVSFHVSAYEEVSSVASGPICRKTGDLPIVCITLMVFRQLLVDLIIVSGEKAKPHRQ